MTDEEWLKLQIFNQAYLDGQDAAARDLMPERMSNEAYMRGYMDEIERAKSEQRIS